MGLFDSARATYLGNKAYRAHIAGNEQVDKGDPAAAKAKYMEAMKLYDQAVELGVTLPNILSGYAILLMREGEFDKAREHMLKMQKIKTLKADDWFTLRVNFSLYQWRVGEVDKAIETIGRAAAEKMNGMIYSTLGMYLVDKAKLTGNFDEALDFNQKALDYDDEDASSLDNMGQLYEAMSDAARSRGEDEPAADYRARAMKYYKKALKQKPRQITTLYYLARMFHQDGDDERARKLLSVRDSLYITAVCPVSREMMEALAKEVN